MPNLTPRRVQRETAPSSDLRAQIKALKETNEDLRTHVQLTDEMIAGLALMCSGIRQYAATLVSATERDAAISQMSDGVDRLVVAWAKRLQVEKNRVKAQIEAQELIVRQAESGIVIPR